MLLLAGGACEKQQDAEKAFVLGAESCPSDAEAYRQEHHEGERMLRCLKGQIPHGVEIEWNAAGEKVRQHTYRDGLMDGPVAHWYPSGRLERLGHYRKDEPVGTHQTWYENGQLRTERTFGDGRENGPSKTWWPNGQIASEAMVVNGRLSGRTQRWDEDGTPIRMPKNRHAPDTAPSKATAE